MKITRPSILSFIFTVILLFLVSVVFFFAQMIALNGVMDGRATTAMVVFGVFQLAIILLGGAGAGWLSKILIAKFNWSKVLAVAVAVLAGTLLGGLFSFFSIIISILLAGIK
jgi:hypothetical protein